MTNWIIMIHRDNRLGNQWEIASECMTMPEAITEFGYYSALLGTDRVRLMVDYFKLKAGDA